MPPATLAIMPAPPVKEAASTSAPALPKWSLYTIEEHLDALIDSRELVEPEQEQEFLAELERTMIAAADKRDHVNAFIVQCEGQAEMAKSEIARLRKRQAYFERAVERMEGYVLRVILQQPLDAKGKYPVLVGNTCSLAAGRNPPRTHVSDEAAVPPNCKTVTVTMPALLWEQLLDSVDFDLASQVLGAVTKPESSVVLDLVKSAIAAAVPGWKKLLEVQPHVYTEEVPGASIKAGTWRLVRS